MKGITPKAKLAYIKWWRDALASKDVLPKLVKCSAYSEVKNVMRAAGKDGADEKVKDCHRLLDNSQHFLDIMDRALNGRGAGLELPAAPKEAKGDAAAPAAAGGGGEEPETPALARSHWAELRLMHKLRHESEGGTKGKRQRRKKKEERKKKQASQKKPAGDEGKGEGEGEGESEGGKKLTGKAAQQRRKRLRQMAKEKGIPVPEGAEKRQKKAKESEFANDSDSDF